jgi:hypothetical protein
MLRYEPIPCFVSIVHMLAARFALQYSWPRDIAQAGFAVNLLSVGLVERRVHTGDGPRAELVRGAAHCGAVR